MTFSDQLNSYIDRLGITRRQLAEASGLSPATISRYCMGTREPDPDSEAVTGIASGISTIAAEKEMSGMDAETVTEALSSCLGSGIRIDYDSFISNLTLLMERLEIKRNELARGIYSDPSYISKILTKARRPGDIGKFAEEVASYLAGRYAGAAEMNVISRLTGYSGPNDSPESIKESLLEWFGTPVSKGRDESVPVFLSSLDRFDLADYMKQVHFDDIKIPPAIPHLPTRKEYTGMQKMMEAEIDFMKTTVLSRSDEDCILYSDMPLEEMASDPEFPKKYMYGMAMMLKRGLHLNFIHDVNRPFPEMMLGLQSNIPLYMTGQIAPYYLQTSQSSVFNHFLKVSGSAALEGTAIAGNQAGGKYTLYRSKEDVAHYRKRAEDLLSHAKPLMDIFRAERGHEFMALMDKAFRSSELWMICSGIPVYLISEALLSEILAKRDIGEAARDKIMRGRNRLAQPAEDLLVSGKLHLVLPALTEEEYEDSPVALSLADMFVEDECVLSFDEYKACTEELEALSEARSGFILSRSASEFSNINITIAGDSMVIVSKEKSPAIHFAIYHKRMIRAFRSLPL